MGTTDVTDQALIRQALDGVHGEDQVRLAKAGLTWVATMLRKNRDYGSAAWEPPVLVPDLPPRTAILVRMSDKVKRVASLMDGKTPLVKNESLEQTLGDLGNYCLLYLTCPKADEAEGYTFGGE